MLLLRFSYALSAIAHFLGDEHAFSIQFATWSKAYIQLKSLTLWKIKGFLNIEPVVLMDKIILSNNKTRTKYSKCWGSYYSRDINLETLSCCKECSRLFGDIHLKAVLPLAPCGKPRWMKELFIKSHRGFAMLRNNTQIRSMPINKRICTLINTRNELKIIWIYS